MTFFSKVWVKHFDLRDFSRSLTFKTSKKCIFEMETCRNEEKSNNTGMYHLSSNA